MDHPLRTFREQRRMSLAALARACGLSKATLSRIENGKQPTTEASLRRILEATGELTANDFIPPDGSTYSQLPPRGAARAHTRRTA